MDKIIVLDCKLEELAKTLVGEPWRGFENIILSHAHEIDIDEFAYFLKVYCGHKSDTPPNFADAIKLFINVKTKQFLESQIKTDTEKKK